MAREILQKNGHAFLGRTIPDAVTAETDYEHSMAWLSGGPQWRKLRKLCNSQVFTTQRLDALRGLRHQMMENMVKRVSDAREAEEAIYIGRLVFGTTLNLLSNMIFVASQILQIFFPILKPLDPQGIKRDIKRSYDRLHALIENAIDRRTKRRASRSERSGDFLDALLDDSEEHGPDELDRRDVRLLLMDLFIGGTDTTSATMEWAMAELLHNPDKMAKAKQELNQKIGSRHPATSLFRCSRKRNDAASPNSSAPLLLTPPPPTPPKKKGDAPYGYLDYFSSKLKKNYRVRVRIRPVDAPYVIGVQVLKKVTGLVRLWLKTASRNFNCGLNFS
ncbi:unnamed protein product [Coffea canephora]|uniref:Cytochrome P450 n=1 Tax=Coffea canephora TaxID=49390 RepID=A0A068UNM1_COFCA|nr:unnamed protein product [Coffea canephora]